MVMETENKYKFVVQNENKQILMKDGSFDFLFSNKKMKKFISWTEAEKEARKHNFVLIPPEIRELRKYE